MARKRGICRMDGCGQPHHAHGLCQRHSYYVRMRGLPEKQNLPAKGMICSVGGCEKSVVARGWCQMHYERVRLGGDLGAAHSTKGTGTNHQGYRRFMEKGKRLLQHRLVMERIIGRPLTATESVHHINGQRDDNRPENLELWDSHQPSGQRVADKVKWMIAYLREHPEYVADQGVRLMALESAETTELLMAEMLPCGSLSHLAS